MMILMLECNFCEFDCILCRDEYEMSYHSCGIVEHHNIRIATYLERHYIISIDTTNTIYVPDAQSLKTNAFTFY